MYHTTTSKTSIAKYLLNKETIITFMAVIGTVNINLCVIPLDEQNLNVLTVWL